MQRCPTCGEENPERARFCLACGAALEEAASLGEERKVVSVLFVDLVGFTDRSDRADPEDVRALLRPYHERVKADIERFGGTVEKFIGDAVMAVFGAPVAHEDDAERAVRSGLRILETIEELRSEGLEISVRAAVTTGEAVVALGVRPERGEGIVTGDVVNTAARLQSAAPVGAVIVDEPTKHSTQGAITFEPLDPVEAKGKAEPVAVWQALQARSLVGQPEAATASPFVGREHERTLLFETFLRAERESSVQIVTVVGEPGIGKSRLVTELRTTLDDRPEIVTWRHGRCLPYGEGITFWALGEIVKAEAGILESDDQDEARAKLDETLAGLFADDAERAWFTSRLGPLVGAGAEGGAVGREETFTAWRRFLEALAARRPTVLVVEDLHWADGALLEFLEHLLGWTTPVPLLLLCTARPELYERQPTWGGGMRNATTISLAPLSDEESAALLHALLERTLLDAEVQSALLERAGGNPLYAEQFARMLSERGGFGDGPLPETVQALVAARLDTLRPELKALLQDAAVVGRVFWTGAAAALGDLERDDVRRGLNELVHREFVRPIRISSMSGEEEFSFWHALVRDVAYHQIPRSPRADKHLAAATWIAEAAGERQEDHAEILVHHHEQAMELAQAAGQGRPDIRDSLAGFLLLAGDRALQLDLEAAEAHYRRALALSEHDDVARATALVRLGTALRERGFFADAIAAYEEAIPTLRTLDGPAAGMATRNLALSLWRAGHTLRSYEVGADAIGLLEEYPGVELIGAYGGQALRASIAGRLDEARSLADQGFATAEALGIDPPLVLLQARGSVGGYAGDPDCVDDLRATLELGRRLGLGMETAVANNNLSDAMSWFEGLRPAREQWDTGIEFARERGITNAVMWHRAERLRCLYHAGDWDELVREVDELVSWEAETGGGQLELFGSPWVEDVLVHRGSVADAARLLDTLLPRARDNADPQVLVPSLVTAALVESARGDAAAAFDRIAELDRLTGGWTPFWRTLLLLWPTRLVLAAGELERAEEFLEGSQHNSAWGVCVDLSARAALAEAKGATLEAAGLYAEAATTWDAYGSIVEQGYALLGLGRCGDAKALVEGQAIFDRLGAAPVVARAA
jgi:class 3 adenylate cyclase/tetratricopeptide (TPR) repeat protein